MFEVGDRIIRKTTRQAGAITNMRRSRALMLEVKWDQGTTQWLPAEEFMLWDVSDPPPAVPASSWGRTTPEYIRQIRSSRQCKDEREKRHKIPSPKELNDLADALYGLSNKRPNQTKHKAARMIHRFESQKLNKPAWHYATTDAERDRLEMKKLYQEKSGDYSY